jgi:hypothetical protein
LCRELEERLAEGSGEEEVTLTPAEHNPGKINSWPDEASLHENVTGDGEDYIRDIQDPKRHRG